ncbi:MAG: hypothetical protein GF331_03015 [Chitinivibrionales bacterium]|nr:hypothetical protein [Chitinivibrionales bacterium]
MRTKTTDAVPITKGPAYHWFGYYDKQQFDPGGRRVLGMAVGFEGRSPKPDDEITIGMVDLADGNSWHELGTSRAWCWQQGCMLQWVPSTSDTIIWNDRDGDRFVSHVLDLSTGRRRTIPSPIYTLAPDGTMALSTDFARINHTRPGYGYTGVPDPNREVGAPSGSGINRVDLESGAATPIVSLATLAALPHPDTDLSTATHWCNHLLINPSGTRFVFLHRWRIPGDSFPFYTRMITANMDGTDMRIVDDSGHMSHFIWRDDTHILGYTQPRGSEVGFYLIDAHTGEARQAFEETRNGHCSYLPGGEWVLNDTYPQGAERMQELYLVQPATGTRVGLGSYRSPAHYGGEWRCDLHPRFSPDGTRVVVDSVHGGNGRQMYMIDIGEVLESRRV